MPLLKGFTNISDSTPINHIKENLISFFDYGLLEKSNFINVTPTGYYGGLDNRLRPVRDPRYSYGQVWQGFRSNWVWESGLGAYTSTDIAYPGVSGVYVNGTFYPVSTTGTYAHHINHPMGRVVFDSAISTTATVTCDYSYKYINVESANGLEWIREIQKQSERSDSTNFVAGSGEWSKSSENRIQLPVIGIELANLRTMSPYGLGGGQKIDISFLFHCVAEDQYMRDHLMDIVANQKEKTIKAYSLDQISSNNAFPLDYRGVPNSGAMRYPELTNTYEGNAIRIQDTNIDSKSNISSDLYIGSVKVVTSCIYFGV